MAAEEQLARVLGPDWERISWVQVTHSSTGLELYLRAE
jgi:hypothetical protein